MEDREELQQEEDEELLTLFDMLPWEDVLYRWVFPCLPLPDIFQLRAASSQALDCVNQYFTCCRFINTSQINSK